MVLTEILDLYYTGHLFDQFFEDEQFRFDFLGLNQSLADVGKQPLHFNAIVFAVEGSQEGSNILEPQTALDIACPDLLLLIEVVQPLHYGEYEHIKTEACHEAQCVDHEGVIVGVLDPISSEFIHDQHGLGVGQLGHLHHHLVLAILVQFVEDLPQLTFS